MKKQGISRVALALSVALSLTVSLVVVDTIAEQGMKAAAALKGSQTATQPLLARSQWAGAANAAHARAC
jgi:hypothetical protein